MTPVWCDDVVALPVALLPVTAHCARTVHCCHCARTVHCARRQVRPDRRVPHVLRLPG
jgi:hypothetical protein